jgi:hypothetical protein
VAKADIFDHYGANTDLRAGKSLADMSPRARNITQAIFDDAMAIVATLHPCPDRTLCELRWVGGHR